MSYTAKKTARRIRENIFFISILFYAFESFFLYGGLFWKNNYWWIDHIDTFIMSLAVYDALINGKIRKYDDANIIAIAIFLMIIGLNLWFYDKTYFTLTDKERDLIDEKYFNMLTLLFKIGIPFLIILKIEKYYYRNVKKT